MNQGLEIFLEDVVFLASALKGIEHEAFLHFERQVRALGGPPLRISRESEQDTGLIAVVGSSEREPAIERYFRSTFSDALIASLESYERSECYVLGLDHPGKPPRLYVGGLKSLGTVYGISELELRLRVRSGKVFLEFPEWGPGAEIKPIFEKPALQRRGEYMNIGYDFENITPQAWSRQRWHKYIDKLVLAKLNCFYFYLWISGNTMYPGSELSQKPENRKIHEDLKDVIDYAHQRGLKVIYMMVPSFLPQDIWDKHPEIHADIVYVRHGFPAVCSSAPGAWDLMKRVWLSEMKWFAKADAIQIWFYDPGGCWCEKWGCRENQSAILTRQVKEFSDLFRQLNPKAEIQYNYWPVWHFESERGMRYRRDLSTQVRGVFADTFQQVVAVGSTNSEAIPPLNTLDDTFPLFEQQLGFQTNVFVFETNPESGYIFLMPNLQVSRELVRAIHERKLDGAFGHRLEAWTRYPGTFFMGQFLWDPELAIEDATRKYCAWQAADAANGARFAEAILLLEKFTYEGAEVETGTRMSEITKQVFPSFPEAHREGLEYFPAMMEALATIGRSVADRSSGDPRVYQEEFRNALGKSSLLAEFQSNAEHLFTKYRGFLERGFKEKRF